MGSAESRNKLNGPVQASTADVVHRRLSAFSHEPRMQPSAGQSGNARQIGHLQRIGRVLIDVCIQRGIGQAPTAHDVGFGDC